MRYRKFVVFVGVIVVGVGLFTIILIALCISSLDSLWTKVPLAFLNLSSNVGLLGLLPEALW